jgi:four helix bundle protein
MIVHYFEDLEIWKLARELTDEIYDATRHPAFSKDYGLVDQIRRASVSVMSNIAEGFEREGNQEFIQFLSIAKGSCGEIRCQLYVGLDQDYINRERFEALAKKARKLSVMISNFICYLKGSRYRGSKFKKPPCPTFRDEVQKLAERLRKA